VLLVLVSVAMPATTASRLPALVGRPEPADVIVAVAAPAVPVAAVSAPNRAGCSIRGAPAELRTQAPGSARISR